MDIEDLVRKTLRLNDVFRGMHRRVYEQGYAPYVDERWHNKEKYEGKEAFISWSLNNGYEIGLELDRKDPKDPYGPDHCQWITNVENKVKDKRKTEYRGKFYTLTELHRDFCDKSISYQGLKGRLSTGWPLEEALTTPKSQSSGWHRGSRT